MNSLWLLLNVQLLHYASQYIRELYNIPICFWLVGIGIIKITYGKVITRRLCVCKKGRGKGEC